MFIQPTGLKIFYYINVDLAFNRITMLFQLDIVAYNMVFFFLDVNA